MFRRPHHTSYSEITSELRQQLKIALPIIVFIGLFEVIMLANTMVAGRISSQSLAVIGVTQSVWMLVFIVFSNITSAINPLTATAHARLEPKNSQKVQANGLVLAIALAPITFGLTYYSDAFLRLFSLNPEIESVVAQSLKIFAWALPPACMLFAIRFFYEGISRPKPMMVIQGMAALFHLVLLWIFVIKANIGDNAPYTIGYLTAITLYFQLVVSTIWYFYDREAKPWRVNLGKLGLDTQIFKDLLRVGLPIGLLAMSEVSFFVITNILAARFDSNWTAAHVMTMSHLTLIYMIPLGLSNAVTVRVARAKAIKEDHLIALRGNIGIGIGCAVLMLSALTLWLMPEKIARIYTNEPIVIQYAASLLGFAALFQLFDAIQVTTVGALRGLQDTFIPSAMAIFSYWVIGAPAVYYFGFVKPYGAKGLWYGLLIGLVLASILLYGRWYRQTSGQNRS